MPDNNLVRVNRVTLKPANQLTSVNIGNTRNYTPLVLAYDREEPSTGAGTKRDYKMELQNPTITFLLDSYYQELPRSAFLPGSVLVVEESLDVAGATLQTKNWFYHRGEIIPTGQPRDWGTMKQYQIVMRVRQYLELTAAEGAGSAIVLRAIDADAGVDAVGPLGQTTAVITPPTAAAFGASTVANANSLAGMVPVLGRNVLGSSVQTLPVAG